MPPRQPLMLKRTAYHASDNEKKNVKMEKGINGLQKGLLNYLIKAKCHSEYSFSFFNKIYVFEKILVDIGSK
jgi:hypothetical protein